MQTDIDLIEAPADPDSYPLDDGPPPVPEIPEAPASVACVLRYNYREQPSSHRSWIIGQVARLPDGEVVARYVGEDRVTLWMTVDDIAALPWHFDPTRQVEHIMPDGTTRAGWPKESFSHITGGATTDVSGELRRLLTRVGTLDDTFAWTRLDLTTAEDREAAEMARLFPALARKHGIAPGALPATLYPTGTVYFTSPWKDRVWTRGVPWRACYDRHAQGDYGLNGSHSTEPLEPWQEWALGLMPVGRINDHAIQRGAGAVRSKYELPDSTGPQPPSQWQPRKRYHCEALTILGGQPLTLLWAYSIPE